MAIHLAITYFLVGIKISKITWQSLAQACKRVLCLIRRSYFNLVITSWMQACGSVSDWAYNESVALKFGPVICGKQRFKQHQECYAMASIQEGKVNFPPFSFEFSTLHSFMFKIHLKSQLPFEIFNRKRFDFFPQRIYMNMQKAILLRRPRRRLHQAR